jgi:hypothetical protein
MTTATAETTHKNKENPVSNGNGNGAALATVSMEALLSHAIDKNMSVEGLTKHVELQERILARNAASEFFAAMAEFQAKCPPIRKTSRADIVTKGGAKFGYTYASLDEIARTVAPILGPLGLSYTWDAKVDEKALLACTCYLRHRDGHVVTATFSCPVGASGRMSEAQEGGATLTYARRQSLVQVLGLTTTDQDNDAARRDDTYATGGEVISDEQVARLDAILLQFPHPDDERRGFLRYLGVESLGRVNPRDYARAMTILQRKLKEVAA